MANKRNPSPTKKLFSEGARKAHKHAKLPTSTQYFAKASKAAKERSYEVEIIFRPGIYDSFTVKTAAFRLNIPRNDGRYGDMEGVMEYVAQSEARLYLRYDPECWGKCDLEMGEECEVTWVTTTGYWKPVAL
jgi:hypothetical protein